MTESMTLVAPGRPMLDYLPVGLFGSVLGLTGLSVGWRLAQAQYGTPGWVPQVIAATAVLAFVSLLTGYRHPPDSSSSRCSRASSAVS